MPLVKETVDRLLKGYDIRLRPDFGGNSVAFVEKPVPRSDFPSGWVVSLCVSEYVRVCIKRVGAGAGAGAASASVCCHFLKLDSKLNQFFSMGDHSYLPFYMHTGSLLSVGWVGVLIIY